MNREIKFRGKRIDNKEWVVGNLIVEYDGTTKIDRWVNALVEPENNYSEMVNEINEVYPESVGIYFGWVDSYEKEIFTGDRLEIQWTDEETTCEIISYSHDYGYFMYGNNPICELIESKVKSKVIGNIHDEVKPAVKDSVIISMNKNIDPNEKAAEEVKEQAEQASEATESAEEGGTE